MNSAACRSELGNDPVEDVPRGDRLSHWVEPAATYGQSYRVKEEITIEDLRLRTRSVIDREVDVVRDQLLRNHVQIVHGALTSSTSTTVLVSGDEERRVGADRVVIATGTRPAHPPEVQFDDRTILDSDGLLHLDRIPHSVVVVGQEVTGIEYASIAANSAQRSRSSRSACACSSSATRRSQRVCRYHLRDIGVVFRLGEEVIAVERHAEGALGRSSQAEASRL